MLTAYEDTENIFTKALAAGAAGYLLKRAPRAELIDAIHEVRRGGPPMTTTSPAKSSGLLQKESLAAQTGEAFFLKGLDDLAGDVGGHRGTAPRTSRMASNSSARGAAFMSS